MDANETFMRAECAMRERQERILAAADRWYLTSQLPEEPTRCARLADALIAVAVWLAPEQVMAARLSHG